MEKRTLAGILGAWLVVACAAVQADDLDVTHGNESWNGQVVPKTGICTRRGGEGWSPEMLVQNIPDGTEHLELRFTDLDWESEGAHGIIRMKLSPSFIKEGSLTLASFKGETDTLPAGMTAIASHKCGKCGGGVYLGPCSGGRAHNYVVNIYALDGALNVLSSGSLPLGVY